MYSGNQSGTLTAPAVRTSAVCACRPSFSVSRAFLKVCMVLMSVRRQSNWIPTAPAVLIDCVWGCVGVHRVGPE